MKWSKNMENIYKVISEIEGMVCITGNNIPEKLKDMDAGRPCYYLPECGLNIHQQAAFVSNIKEPNAVIITYSAFIVSDFRRKQVLFFEDDESFDYPDFEIFGASVNKINMCLFGRKETAGDYALEALNRMKQKIDDGEIPNTLIHEVSKTFGDSIEKTLLIKMILDKSKNKSV